MRGIVFQGIFIDLSVSDLPFMWYLPLPSWPVYKALIPSPLSSIPVEIRR